MHVSLLRQPADFATQPAEDTESAFTLEQLSVDVSFNFDFGQDQAADFATEPADFATQPAAEDTEMLSPWSS